MKPGRRMLENQNMKAVLYRDVGFQCVLLGKHRNFKLRY